MKSLKNKIIDNLKLGLAGLVLAGSLNGCEDASAQEYIDSLNPLNVKYVSFEEPLFDSIIKESNEIPEQIKRKIKYRDSYTLIRDKEQFNKNVFNEALKLGYNKEKISQAKPKEAIQLTVEVVSEKMSYYDVDNDPSFDKLRKDELFPEDDLFSKGVGDCDKYSKLTTSVFNILKDVNPNLKNIYLIDEEVAGGRILGHSWNAIIFSSNNSIYVSHIDPTFYDNKGELQAKKDYHIAENELEFLAEFYKDIGDFETSININKELLNQIADKEKRAGIYDNLSFYACIKNDSKLMDFVVKNFYTEQLKKYKYEKRNIEENKRSLEEWQIK